VGASRLRVNSLTASPVQKELPDELPRMSGGDGIEKVAARARNQPWTSRSYPVTQTYSPNLGNLLGNIYLTLKI